MSAFRVRPFRAAASAPLALAALGAVLLVGMPSAGAAQPPVALGTADSFSVLAYSGITNTGHTTITGDVGSFPTASETGFSPPPNFVTLGGTNHAGDPVTQGAKNDLVTAYNDAAGRTPVTNLPVELGGSTLVAGVYVNDAVGTFGLTGTLVLDAQGNTSAEFIFKTATTLITASNSRVLLVNGADPCHVVWKVGSSATFGTGTQFVGNVLAHDSITAQTSATFQGRLLASNGAVTLDTNTITTAACLTSGGSGGTTSTTTAPTSTTVTTAAIPVVPAASASGATSRGTPAGTPGATSGGTPAGTPGGLPTGTPGGTPGTPGGTPGTPGTAPKLPFTGGNTAGPIAVGLALLAGGALVLAAERRVRKARPTSR